MLEEAFSGYLQALQPSETLLTLTKAMFKNVWDQRAEQAQAGMVSLKRDVTKIEKQIDGLLDRIVDTTIPSVASAYEKRLARLEQDKLVAQEKLGKSAQPSHSFEQLFELACAFLANPRKLWESGQLTLQRTVLKLTFVERISYCQKTGLRTPKTTLPFKVLEGFTGQNSEMAERQGFEPWDPVKGQRFSRPPRSTTPPPLRVD